MGDPGTYQHPLIPEDVLVDKSGLEALLEQTTLTCPDTTASEVEVESVTVEEKVEEEASEEVLPDDTMAVTEVGSVSCINS